MKEGLSVCVAIPTRNRLDSFKRCFRSVIDQTRLPHEIIIVDQSDSPGIEDWLKTLKLAAEMRVVYVSSRTPGLPRARNTAIDRCKSDVLVAVDDDVTLDKSFLEEVAVVFENDSEGRVGMVCGELTTEGQPAPALAEALVQGYNRLFLLPRYGSGRFQASGAITTVKAGTRQTASDVECSGCVLAYRAEVARKFRPDTALEKVTPYGWGEDDDVCYRVSREYRIVHNPKARFWHRAGGRPHPYLYYRARMENSHYLYRKNLPRTLKHKAAFWYSTFGVLLWVTALTVVRLDVRPLRGTLRGLVNVLGRR